MSKKKLLLMLAIASCLVLLLSITALAADDNIYVDFEYLGGNNTAVPRSTLLGNLFTVDTVDNVRTITGIRDTLLGDTPISSKKLVSIHIPIGVNKINITNSTNSRIKKIVFDYRCDVVVSSLKIDGLEEIVIAGDSARITFGSGCAPETLKRITITSPRATVTFGKESFKDLVNLESLDISKCTDLNIVSSYTFGENAFRNTGLTSLMLDDDRAEYKFDGKGAFSACTRLGSVYLGKKVTDVSTGAFENCIALKNVYSDALATVGDRTFAVADKSDRVALKVYIHSSEVVNVSKSAFSGRLENGVVLCALETSNVRFDNCEYTLHFGIPHEYTLATEETSCYISYKTDCPCQKVGNAYYKLYTRSGGDYFQKIQLVAGPNPNENALHSYTGAYKLEYPNGIENYGTIQRKCGICGEIEEEEREVMPVLKILGYSVSETGNKSMVMGVRFNYSSLMQYQEINGVELEYGFVLAVEERLNGEAPFDENGNAKDGVVYVEMSSSGYYETTMKLSGIGSNADKKIIMAVYLKIGKEIVYYQGKGETRLPTGTSYNDIVAALPAE